jgi:hypothetical protein
LNYEETAHVARRVFDERGTHAFPPAFTMPTEWRTEVEAMAADLKFHIGTAEAIEPRFREVLDGLNESSTIR